MLHSLFAWLECCECSPPQRAAYAGKPTGGSAYGTGSARKENRRGTGGCGRDGRELRRRSTAVGSGCALLARRERSLGPIPAVPGQPIWILCVLHSPAPPKFSPALYSPSWPPRASAGSDVWENNDGVFTEKTRTTVQRHAQAPSPRKTSLFDEPRFQSDISIRSASGVPCAPRPAFAFARRGTPTARAVPGLCARGGGRASLSRRGARTYAWPSVHAPARASLGSGPWARTGRSLAGLHPRPLGADKLYVRARHPAPPRARTSGPAGSVCAFSA